MKGYTIKQIQESNEIENFSFKKTNNGSFFYDDVIIEGDKFKVWISKETLKTITEQPEINTLRFEQLYDINDDSPRPEFQILLKDELTEEDKVWEKYEQEIGMRNAKYKSKEFDDLLDDINGDWGGLYGDEANLGKENCD